MTIRDFSDEREFKNLRIKKSIFQEVGSFAYDNDLSLARCVETALCEWLDKQYELYDSRQRFEEMEAEMEADEEAVA